jgi:predicted RNA-binding Zn-ribbon protein involved in translation (DUF1610 family)
MIGINNIILVEEEFKAPITIICESCGHRITSYCELPEKLICPSCGKEIDLK